MIITSRSDAGQPPAKSSPPDGWQHTRAQTALVTQFIGDEEQYLDAGQRDIGRPVGHGDRELFVACAPGEALQQQFEHLQPEFIAVHDLATRSSRQLVAGLAAAAKRTVQKLVVRRQGMGTPLATLSFVELQNADGTPLRIYSTEAECDPAERPAIARALLAFSRLGVMMVGDMPQPALTEKFNRWHAELTRGAWPNRQLLLLPLAAANALATLGLDLARGTPLTVRTTPKVTRAADAWGFIESTWARLRGQPGSTGLLRPPSAAVSSPVSSPPSSAVAAAVVPAAAVAPAPARPASGIDAVSRPMSLDLKPMPAIAARLAPAQATARDETLARYVKQVGELAGMVSCCIFDIASGKEVMHAGADPWQVELGRHGSELLLAMAATGRALGLGRAQPDAAITFGEHHLLLRAVPHRAGLALHAVLDKTHGNLTLARLRLERLDETLNP